MSINQLRNFGRRVYAPPRPIVNTMEINQKIATEQPKTVAEKKAIIESDNKEDIKINNVNDIIKLKPSKKKVRDFFKIKVQEMNDKIDENI